MASLPSAERALRVLQRLVRQPADPAQTPAMTRRLPDDLAAGNLQTLSYTAAEVSAVNVAITALLADLRFEHLGNAAADKVWHFAAKCCTDRERDHVPAFIEQHQQEPTSATCYLPVEFLTVNAEIELGGIKLLPVDDPPVPESSPLFTADTTGCTAAAEVRGTDYERMADRARHTASHALRVLRIGLGEYPGINERQLRFRLGTSYAFNDQLAGWQQRPDVAYDLTLPGDLGPILGQPVAQLPAEPRNDIERKAGIALAWMERALLAGDDLVALLYRFFALEALLGDKSEGLKSHGLAFRQMTLAHIVTGFFPHPNATMLLYDEVRNEAVHGGTVPDVSPAIAHSVERGVRQALSQYLILARDRGLTRRSRLLRVLDDCPDRPKLVAFLREYGGEDWTRYLDRMEWPHSC
jgi:hypothetical protein